MTTLRVPVAVRVKDDTWFWPIVCPPYVELVPGVAIRESKGGDGVGVIA
jgi:hypothetical protein